MASEYENIQLYSNYQEYYVKCKNNSNNNNNENSKSLSTTIIRCNQSAIPSRSRGDDNSTALKLQRPNIKNPDNINMEITKNYDHNINLINDNSHNSNINNMKNNKNNLGCYFNFKANKFTIALLLILSLLLKLNLCCGFILDGTQNSFAQFRKWYTLLNGTLELEFKTEQPNGLLLYTDDGGTFDFFELKLVEGALRLRYNLGGGAQIITVGRDIHDGHWHKVQVSFPFFYVLKISINQSKTLKGSQNLIDLRLLN